MEAAKGLVLILLDCTDRSRHQSKAEKYGVKALPSVVFLDAEGSVVGLLEDRQPLAVAKEFRDLKEKYSRAVPWAESLEKGLAQGKREDKPVLVFFSDDGKDSGLISSFLVAPGMKKLLQKFVAVKHRVEKKCETCKRFRMSKGGKLQILDPAAEDPAKKPFYRLPSKKKAADFKKALESGLKRWDKAKAE